MKKDFHACPPNVQPEMFGFSWLEYALAIPQPLVLVTSYKSNGLPNAAMQSWCAFSGNEGFHCLFSGVHKSEHMYSSVLEKRCFVVNFPSKDVFMRCMATIEHNGFDDDELAASGLTAVPAKLVDAPAVAECFLSLECELEWSRDLVDGGEYAVVCGKVLGFSIDEEHFGEKRYGADGYLYNIRASLDPRTGERGAADVGTIAPLGGYDKL